MSNSSGNNSSLNWTQIIVALIGAMGVIGASLIAFRSDRISSREITVATATVYMPDTPTSMPTKTSLPSTKIPTDIPRQTLTASPVSNVPTITCVPQGVEDHKTSDPRYVRPDGYSSAWITSDPSILVLPDGTSVPIIDRYVLIVDNLAEVQIQNVEVGLEHSNTWGCWFRSDFSSVVYDEAVEQLEKMRQENPNVITSLYRVSSNGLEKLE